MPARTKPATRLLAQEHTMSKKADFTLADCPTASFALAHCSAPFHDLTAEVQGWMPSEEITAAVYDPASGVLMVTGRHEAKLPVLAGVDAEPVLQRARRFYDMPGFYTLTDAPAVTLAEYFDLRLRQPLPPAAADDAAALQAATGKAVDMVQRNREDDFDQVVENVREELDLLGTAARLSEVLQPLGYAAGADVGQMELYFYDQTGDCVPVAELPPEAQAAVTRTAGASVSVPVLAAQRAA
jgi:hypothetical protein